MLIPTAKNTRNITDFRKNPDSVLEAVQGKSDPLYLFRGSTPKAVVIDIEEYARLYQKMEDYQDMLDAQEYLENSNKDSISFDDFLIQNKINLSGRHVSRKNNFKSK